MAAQADREKHKPIPTITLFLIADSLDWVLQEEFRTSRRFLSYPPPTGGWLQPDDSFSAQMATLNLQ